MEIATKEWTVRWSPMTNRWRVMSLNGGDVF